MILHLIPLLRDMDENKKTFRETASQKAHQKEESGTGLPIFAPAIVHRSGAFCSIQAGLLASVSSRTELFPTLRQ